MRARIDIPFDDGAARLPATGRIGWFNLSPDVPTGALPRDRIAAIQPLRPAHDALIRAGITAAPEDNGPFALAIVTATRSRAETHGLIAAAQAAVAPGGAVIVEGDRGNGIDALYRGCRDRFGLTHAASRAHGRVFVLDPGAAVATDWAEAAKPAATAAGFITAPGMFSQDGPDPASVLLADTALGHVAGVVADLGAGWGYLSARLRAADAITRLELFEADASALDAARINAADPRCSFHWADVTQTAGPRVFDTVVMNPPFHAGRASDPALGRDFIAAAAGLLVPRGQLWMVANRHLAYEDHLDRAFRSRERVAETGAFKVIRAQLPRVGARA